MKNIILASMISCITLSSCATMFSGSKETITVHSDRKDASLYLNDEKIGTGSATTVIPKKKLKDAVLRASKSGCEDKTTGIKTELDPLTLLGVLIDWGIISVILVDWIGTGAVKKAERTNYNLTPEC